MDKHDHTRETNEHYYEHKKGWRCTQKKTTKMIKNTWGDVCTRECNKHNHEC